METMRLAEDSPGRAELIRQLAATANEIETRIPELASAAGDRRSGSNDWSPVEIFRHLRASDQIVSNRMWAALVRPDAVFVDLDERKYAVYLARTGISLEHEVELFVLERKGFIGLLGQLSNEEWGTLVRTDVAEHSLYAWLIGLAVHEREHLAQLRSAIDATR
jgi:hypothetical protein